MVQNRGSVHRVKGDHDNQRLDYQQKEGEGDEDPQMDLQFRVLSDRPGYAGQQTGHQPDNAKGR